MMRRMIANGTALLLLLLGAADLRGQGRPGGGDGGPEPLRVTLVSAEHAGPPLLVRRPGVEARNLVLVNTGTTTPEQLSEALYGLALAEAMDPQGRQRREDRAVRLRLPQPVPTFPWTAATLEELKAAEEQVVRGLGKKQAITIAVPRNPPLMR